MTRHAKVLWLALALALTGCSGKSGDATGPDVEPPPINDPVPPPNDPGQLPNDPGTPPPQNQGVQGTYVLEQVNQSQLGQLVTLSNPDGTVIGLYRFQATDMVMTALQTFNFRLRYSDDVREFGLADEGEFKQAGPVAQDGALPLTFSSAIYEDKFTGVVLGDFVAIKYDFDGDGALDTSFGFRRVQ